MKRNKKNTALFVLIAVVVIGLAVYFINRNNNKLEAVHIGNDSKQDFEALGIADDSQILLCKDENSNYVIPNSLFANGGTFRIVAKDSDGNSYTSKEISLKENDKIKIKNVSDNELILENENKGEKKDIDIPDIKNWDISKDGDNLGANFSSKTDYDYTVYVVGKGGELAISDTLNNGKEVSASWEAGKNMTSLVKFDLK